MAELNAKFPASKLMANVEMTVTITGMRRWRWRLWIAQQFLILAAVALGTGLRIELEDRCGR